MAHEFLAPVVGGYRSYDLRDDSACFTNLHLVSRQQAEPTNLILVVKRHAADNGTVDLNRLQNPNGCQGSGSADLNRDVTELGHYLRLLELVGDRPARCAAGFAHSPLDLVVVDLEHQAVGREVQTLQDRLTDLGYRRRVVRSKLATGWDVESQYRESIHIRGMRDRIVFPTARVVGQELQAAFDRLVRVVEA